MYISCSIKKNLSRGRETSERFTSILGVPTNNIYATLTQTEPYESYMVNDTCDMFTIDHPCNSSNNAFGGQTPDWPYAFNTCPAATSKRKCSKPNPNLCNIGNSSSGQDPFIDVTWGRKENIAIYEPGYSPPTIRCSYDINKIDTLEQINNYMNKSGSSEAFDQMMELFCSKESNTCPRGPNSTQNMAKCSRLKSTDDAGQRCRGWLTKQNDKTKDNIIDNYCLNYPNNEDCRCQNRANDNLYKETKSGNEIPDGCWYMPCSTGAYLQKGKDHCPQNMCKVIYDMKKNNDIIMQNNSNTINCNFSTFKQDEEEKRRKEEEEKKRKEEEERRRREEEERRKEEGEENNILKFGIGICIIIILGFIFLRSRR